MDKLLLLLLPTYAHAKVYKCEINGKTTYQQKQCADTDSAKEVKLRKGISIDQQIHAVNKLNQRLVQETQRLRLKKQRLDKERMIRAAENQANATYQNALSNRLQAEQQRRQAKALERKNEIERGRLNTVPFRWPSKRY